MANKTVTLYRKCKTPGGWKRFPAAMSANGKVKPNTVMESGADVVYPTGHYELRSFEGSKTVWTRVTGNATEALAALRTAQERANTRAIAGDAGVAILPDITRLLLRDEVKRWVTSVLNRKSKEAAELYERTAESFLSGCKRRYADELTNDDVVAFHKQERNRGMSDRTVANRHAHLRTFFIWLKFDRERLKDVAGPKPKFEKTLPEIYEPADLKKFFASLTNGYDLLLFDLLLTTGLRDREAAHLKWVDIRWSRRVLQVSSTPHWRHKIKDSEEREMPLTSDLLESLRGRRQSFPASKLIFGARGGAIDKPDGHLLRRLKHIARDAGLNCGSCGPCTTSDECEQWFLHKFRATYITTLLRSGMDLRTVMSLSGHADLESVIRYLRPADGKAVQDAVNGIEWR